MAPGQRDTDSLPPYPVLDEVLKVLIEGQRLADWEYDKATAFVEDLRTTEQGRSLIDRISRMIARNEYKRRQAPPIIRVRSRALAPIWNSWAAGAVRCVTPEAGPPPMFTSR